MTGRDEAFSQQCEEVRNWERLLESALEHGVAGVLMQRIADTGISLPAKPREAIEQRLAVDRLWHRHMTGDLRQVLQAFAEDGLHTVTLKGPVLSERLYPRAALRASGDLDLLVRPADMAQARETLIRIGYSPRPGAPLLHASVFDHSGGGNVDLHYRASDGFATTLEAENLVTRSIPYDTADAGRAWILAPEDEFLYLAVHAARHRFLRLRWLYDLHLFAQHHPDLAWETIAIRAKAHHVQRAVSTTCEALERLLPETLPEAAKAHLRQEPVRSRIVMAVASLSAVADDSVWRKSYRVFWHVTYHALLGESSVASIRFWWQSLAQAAARLWRTR